MAWQTPKTDWTPPDGVTDADLNRIEGNIQELQNTKETPSGAQTKVDTHEAKAAPHSGHETPVGRRLRLIRTKPRPPHIVGMKLPMVRRPR